MFNKKNKTQGEVLRDLKKNAEFMAKMKFIKERFYPALCEATTSIEDAISNLSIINNVMMDKFLGFMKEKKFVELHMENNLSASDPKHEQLKALLDLFNEMSVFEAKEHFEGMRQEIQLFLNEEQKNRQLSELKAVWIDEIKK